MATRLALTKDRPLRNSEGLSVADAGSRPLGRNQQRLTSQRTRNYQLGEARGANKEETVYTKE